MRKTLSVKKQTHELCILYRPQMKNRMFCIECKEEVRWILPEEAMALRGTSLREIFRSIESDDLHYVETADGYLLVCANSLNQDQKTTGDKKNEITHHYIAY